MVGLRVPPGDWEAAVVVEDAMGQTLAAEWHFPKTGSSSVTAFLVPRIPELFFSSAEPNQPSQITLNFQLAVAQAQVRILMPPSCELVARRAVDVLAEPGAKEIAIYGNQIDVEVGNPEPWDELLIQFFVQNPAEVEADNVWELTIKAEMRNDLGNLAEISSMVWIPSYRPDVQAKRHFKGGSAGLAALAALACLL